MATLTRLSLNDLTPQSPDRELLERYVRERDEQAFAALMARHGRMVKAVCRRVLGNDADADDATQATLLVFVRKAADVRDRNGLANWLFGVAHKVALKAKQTRARRQAHEAKTPPRPPQQVATEFAELLQLELAKLPPTYRAVVVLCDLEGQTLADAAKQLGIPTGTVASRLARGRNRLADRLRKLGLAVSAGLLTTWLTDSTSAAVRFDPDVSAPILSLAEDVMRSTLILPKLVTCLALMGVGGSLVFAAVAWGQTPPPAAELPKTAPPKDAPNKDEPKPDPKGFAPFFILSQALVERDGDDTLKVWIQVPVGRFLTLTDAKGKKVHVHDTYYPQLGAVSMPVADVQVFDIAGNKKAKADWKTLFKDRTRVIYAVEGMYDLKTLRKEFAGFFKDDVLVLVVPKAIDEKIDKVKGMPEIESLPQAFPGQQPKPGDPVPPPKK